MKKLTINQRSKYFDTLVVRDYVQNMKPTKLEKLKL